jgi:hypothetical protein
LSVNNRLCALLAFPLGFVLLKDKHSRTYRMMFDAIKRAAKKIGLKFAPKLFITDFESGIISTIKAMVSTQEAVNVKNGI